MRFGLLREDGSVLGLGEEESVVRRAICDDILAALGNDFSAKALSSILQLNVDVQGHRIHRNKMRSVAEKLRSLPLDQRKHYLECGWEELSPQHGSNKVQRVALRTYVKDIVGLCRRLYAAFPGNLNHVEVVSRANQPTELVLKFERGSRVRIEGLAKIEDQCGKFQEWIESGGRRYRIYSRNEYVGSPEFKLINQTKPIDLQISAETPWQPYEMLTKTRLDDLERQSQYEQYKEKPAPSDQAASASPTKAVETAPVSASAAPGLPMKPSASIGLLLGDAVAVELQRLSSKRAPPSGAVISREVAFLLRDNSLPAPANAIRIRAPRFDLWNPVSESRLEQMRSGYQRAYFPPPYCPCTEDSSSLGGDSPPVVADGGGAPTDDGIDSAHEAQDLRGRLGWSSLPMLFLLPCCHESVCCSPCRSSGC